MLSGLLNLVAEYALVISFLGFFNCGGCYMGVLMVEFVFDFGFWLLAFVCDFFLNLDSCSIVEIFKISKICYGDMLVCLS